MFKTLLKKQLKETNAFYFVDRKTGKLRSKASVTKTLVLYGLLFLIVAVSVGAMAVALAMGIVGTDQEWVYFALQGIIAILFGTFGSVFNTYAGLYTAKDNDLLLSMPIKPMYILAARGSSVYAMSLLYSGLIWVPTVVLYWAFRGPIMHVGLNLGQILFPFLLTIIIPGFVSVLTCILGWVVALIAAKITSKNAIKVIVSLIVFGVYYVFCFKLSDLITQLLMNIEAVGAKIRVWAYPIYVLGVGATGKLLPMLAFTVLTLILVALCMYILAKSYIKLITTSHAAKKVKYEEKTVKNLGADRALLKKELKRFTSSTTYLMNCGLGLVILPILAIVLIVKIGTIDELFDMLAQDGPAVLNVFGPLVACIICLILSMNTTTSPAVSLEGHNIWIAQSLPVSAWQALRAKLMMHVYVNTLPTLVFTLVICIVLKFSLLMTIAILIMTMVYMVFMGVLGLTLNLLKPNLSWTNETVPVKQSMSVVVSLFGGWFVSIVFGALAFALSGIPGWIYILGVSAILVAIDLVLIKWLKTKGANIFARL